MSDTTSHSADGRPDAHVTALLDALRLQSDRLDQLHDLAGRQSQFIEARQSEPLIALLSQRQQLIDAVQQGHDDVSMLTEHLPVPVAQLPDEQRTEVQSLARHINDRLAEVLSHDKQAEDRLRTLRDAARDELSSLGAAQQASRAYRNPSQPGSRFADRRG